MARRGKALGAVGWIYRVVQNHVLRAIFLAQKRVIVQLIHVLHYIV